MVQRIRTWSEGNELSTLTIVGLIYDLMEHAYLVLTDRPGQDRKRILLAVLLHSLDTKSDWSSPEDKHVVMTIVRKAGASMLNWGPVNIKEKALEAIRTMKEGIDEIKKACGCIP